MLKSGHDGQQPIAHCPRASVKLFSSLWNSQTSSGLLAVFANSAYSAALTRYCSEVNMASLSGDAKLITLRKLAPFVFAQHGTQSATQHRWDAMSSVDHTYVCTT